MSVRFQRIAGVILALVSLAFILYFVQTRERAVPEQVRINNSSSGVANVPIANHSSGVTSRSPRPSADVSKRRTATPLPEPTTPWQDVDATLRDEIRGGDLDAAHRLASDTLRCRNFQSLQDRVQRATEAYQNSQATDAVRAQYEHQLADLQREVERSNAVCGDVPPKAIDNALFSTLEDAALLGDEMAQLCFVDSSIFASTYPNSSSGALREEYMNVAPELADNAIRSGNWEMVSLLAGAYTNAPVANATDRWLADIAKPDPLAAYSFMLLERSGMKDNAARQMDESLRSFRIDNSLTDAQVSEARHWATGVHDRYFKDRPFPSGEAASICSPDVIE